MSHQIKMLSHHIINRLQTVLGALELETYDIASKACEEICDIAHVIQDHVNNIVKMKAAEVLKKEASNGSKDAAG